MIPKTVFSTTPRTEDMAYVSAFIMGGVVGYLTGCIDTKDAVIKKNPPSSTSSYSSTLTPFKLITLCHNDGASDTINLSCIRNVSIKRSDTHWHAEIKFTDGEKMAWTAENKKFSCPARQKRTFS